MSESDDTPLLVHFPEGEHGSGPDRDRDRDPGIVGKWSSEFHKARRTAQRHFSTRTRHWLVLILVILDVAGILADIFISLITCELGKKDEPWVGSTRQALTTFSLVMSCIFMVELFFSVLVDGFAYFKEKLHCFDAIVIVAGFAVDLLEHNEVGEIASLIVMLRLWRVIKIVDEFSVQASESMDGLRREIDDLEKQNRDLRERLTYLRVNSGDQEDSGHTPGSS